MTRKRVKHSVATILLAVFSVTTFSGSSPTNHNHQTAGFENILDYAIALCAKYQNDPSYLLSEIAIRRAKTGDTDAALELANTIKDESYRASALAGIADDLIDRDKQTRASEVLSLLRLVETKDGARKPRYATYLLDHIGKPFVRTGQFGRILELAETGKDDYEIRTALDTVMEGYRFDQENKGGSEQLLRKVLQLSKLLKNGEDGRVIQRVALVYAEAGNYERALAIAEGLADGEVNFDRDETIQQIAFILAMEGQHERAIQLVRSADQYFREEGLIEMAAILLSQKKEPAALELLSEVQKAISGHIEEMLDEGDLPGFEVVRLAEIATKYLKAGKKEVGVEILNRAATAAVKVRKPVERQSAIEAVSQAYAEAGLFTESISLANRSEYDKVKLLARAAVEMINQGKMEDAAKVVTSMEQLPLKEREESKADALATISDSYVNRGERARALDVLLRAFQIARLAKVNDFQPTTMQTIAVKLAQLGEFETSFEVVREIQSTFHKIDSLADIGVLQAKTKHVLSSRSRAVLTEMVR